MICVVKDIPVYYQEYGKGIPILCIHGYTVDHRIMTGCLEPLFTQKSGYRRIYLDLPGMGQTPQATWLKNADIMLEFLEEFINLIIPDEDFLVIGESYGGYLTLGLIRSMPTRIKGAFLICPVIVTKDRKLPEKVLLWQSPDFQELTEDVSEFLELAVIATPTIYDKFTKDISPAVKIADNDFLSLYGQCYSFSFEDKLKEIIYDKPTAILTGRQDQIVGYADAFEILNCLPRATYAVLDCSGHNLQIENEPLFSQLIEDWLWRVSL